MLEKGQEKIIAALLFFIFLTVLFFIAAKYFNSGNNIGGGGTDAFNFQKTDLSYYEFVYEDSSCESGECLVEYIVQSDGTVFLKKETKKNNISEIEIKAGMIEKKEAESLVYSVKNAVANVSGTGGVDCVSCQLYHLFYGDPFQTKTIVKYRAGVPGFMLKVRENTELGLETMALLDPFFVHFVFEPRGKSTVDYHFYPNGLVLREEFGRKNGELLDSAIYSVSSENIDSLKRMVEDNYFASQDNLYGCVRSDFSWGYLEIKKGDAYRAVFTCGNGSSGADKLFNELLNKTNGK